MSNGMMKKHIKMILSSIMTLLTVLTLVNCAQKSGSPTIVTTAANPETDGTMDTGGGTGIDNKVFESYKVDPTTLSAYVKYVKPLLENIKTSKGEDAKFKDLFKYKPWYFIPSKLANIDKDSLGVSFLKNSTQQIARQSMKSIWVDKEIFDVMAEEDQADLLLHEMVMNLYFYQFLSLTDVCRLNEIIKLTDKDAAKGCSGISPEVEKMFPVQPMRKLTSQDNENIRAVTGWLIENANKPISEMDFVKLMYLHDFDKRFFNPKNYLSDEERNKPNKEVSRKEYLTILRAAALSGRMPSLCVDAARRAQVECQVEFTEKTAQYRGINVPALNMKIKMGSSVLVDIDTLLSEKISLSTNTNENEQGELVYTAGVVELNPDHQVGEIVYSGMLQIREVKTATSQLVLDKIFIAKGVVVSSELGSDKESVCEVRNVKANNAFEGEYAVIQPDGKLSLEDEFLLKAYPAFSLCSGRNSANQNNSKQ